MRLVFDLESDGLLEDITKVHCIAVFDCDSGKKVLYEPHQLQAGLDHIAQAGDD